MNFKKKVNGSWVDTPHYIHNTSTDTLTTPADIYANDTTAMMGLKGNMEQASGVSPTTPIQPQETGERTGNLINLGSWSNQYSTDTRTFFSARFRVSGGNYKQIDIKSTGTYKLTLDNLTNETVEFLHNGSARNILIFSYTANFAEPTNLTLSFTASGYDPTTINGINLSGIMLNTGSTALPYEPYGYKIPILSNSTTTPVYLGEVETTRNIKKLVLNGTENWLSEEGNGRYSLPNVTPLVQFANQLCTHFQLATSYSDFYFNDLKFGVSNRPCLLIHYTACQTVSAFKAFLAAEYAAGRPVTIWYVLPTPQTAVVNEPLRKIGDYADEVSGITIPTIAGANTIDIDTTLKPSEMSVNYKGWHPVADVHEYNSNYTIATMQALTIAQLQTHTISELEGGWI